KADQNGMNWMFFDTSSAAHDARRRCNHDASRTSRRGSPSCLSRLYRDAEQLLHRLQRAGQLRSLAREAETNVALTPCAEVDARHASNPAVLDEVFNHAPRHGFVSRLRAGSPIRVDAQERVEC